MSKGDNRPVNLDLTTMRFPITAIASIIHRISGVVLFFAFPFIVCLFSCSLESAEGFDWVVNWLQQPFIKIALFAVMLAAAYHTLAGLRHIVMDFGYFETLKASQSTAIFVFIATLLVGGAMGVWIW